MADLACLSTVVRIARPALHASYSFNRLWTLGSCRDLCAEMQREFALCFDGRIADELRRSGARVDQSELGSLRGISWNAVDADHNEQERYDLSCRGADV